MAGWYKPHSVLRRAVGHGQLSSCPQLPGEPGGATFSGSPGSAPVTRAPGRRSRPCPSLTGHLRRARPSPWLPNRRPTGAARIASPPSSKHGAKGQAAPRRAGDLRRGSGRWRRYGAGMPVARVIRPLVPGGRGAAGGLRRPCSG